MCTYVRVQDEVDVFVHCTELFQDLVEPGFAALLPPPPLLLPQNCTSMAEYPTRSETHDIQTQIQ